MRNAITVCAFLAVLTACLPCNAAGIIVTFDPPPAPHGSILLDSYCESGVVFEGQLDGSFAHGDCGRDGRPDDGTACLSVTRAYTWFHMGGVLFDVVQVDLAEYSTVFAEPMDITFLGHKAGSATVEVTFSIDGVIDGTGPEPDFEAFTFPDSFSCLTRVDMLSPPFAMDNLCVVPVPEASTVGLAATSLMCLLLVTWTGGRRAQMDHAS